MGSIISMALSAVIGCGLCVAAAAGITQVATTHIPVQVQQPLVDYGTRTGPTMPTPGASNPAGQPSTTPTTTQPGKAEPGKTQPAKTQPAKKQPGKAEPGKTQPAQKKPQPGATQKPGKTTGPVKGKPTPDTPNDAPGKKK